MSEKRSNNRQLYARLIAVALPMIIQNGISNFVSMLDNIMVGQVGTLQMSGVAIVNQLMFVFNLCIFGAASGAGIFTAQFKGSNDDEGIRHTFRFKILVAFLLTAVGIAILLPAGASLIGLYLEGDGNAADAAATLGYGLEYLRVMLFGLLPFALTNAYSGTLRETGETRVPMLGGVAAVLCNLVLNYVLIFGNFGAPALGIRGAAVATVISRYLELAIVAGWTHTHAHRKPFIRGAYRSMVIPGSLAKKIIAKGMPLLLNEFFWSTGITVINQCYSTRGLDVVAAFNIATVITQLCSVVFLAMGNSVGIVMGQMLGANLLREQIMSDNRKLSRLSVVSCLVFTAILIGVSGLFPRIYNTTDQVRAIATGIICISAVMLPINSYNNVMYFTLRSGGQTFITFLFDSGFTWVVCVPVAYLLAHFTDVAILPMYALCVSVDVLKIALGRYILNKGTWIQRIIE